MKKLMLAAAVAAISTATLAADGIVSSSVVGYQNKALAGGYDYNLTVSTFQTVGKEKSAMTIGDIGASASWMTGSDEVKTLLANGAVDKAYTYVNATDASDWGCPEGWYLTDDVNDDSIEDLTDYCKNSTLLPLGNGLLTLVGSASTTLTYAGQVLEEDQLIGLNGGYDYNITGNISPADITLGDITASNGWMTGSDELKTLEANGAVKAAYTYVNETDASDWGCPAGWYLTDDVNDDSIEDLTDYCKNTTPVSAGEAFIVLVGSASTTITVPSAL